MDGAQLGAFVIFSLVGSFTPGPNTTIATATGANFGFRAVVPHIAGVPVGMTTLLVLGSLGVTGALSLVAWAWLGAALREWLRLGNRLRVFNALMAVSLIATAVWMAATP